MYESTPVPIGITFPTVVSELFAASVQSIGFPYSVSAATVSVTVVAPAASVPARVPVARDMVFPSVEIETAVTSLLLPAVLAPDIVITCPALNP